jgi:hypothetical protein
MPLWNPIVEGLSMMSESKDISKKRLSDFLAARLRAKRSDKPRDQPASTESRPIVSARSEQTTGPVTQS